MEKVYQRALLVELNGRGLQADLEVSIQVLFNTVIEAQPLNQLKATGVEVGLLISSDKDKVEFKRMVGGDPSVSISIHPWPEKSRRAEPAASVNRLRRQLSGIPFGEGNSECE